MTNQPEPNKLCPACGGKGTTKVLGGGGDYEDWECQTCKDKTMTDPNKLEATPVTDECREMLEFHNHSGFCISHVLQRLKSIEKALNSRTAELEQVKRQLLFANDAADKGYTGREMGTALEECQKELTQLQADFENAVDALSELRYHDLTSSHSPVDCFVCERVNKALSTHSAIAHLKEKMPLRR